MRVKMLNKNNFCPCNVLLLFAAAYFPNILLTICIKTVDLEELHDDVSVFIFSLTWTLCTGLCM